MTIIVAYDNNGNAIFRSITGVGSSEQDRELAIKLDILIKEKIDELMKGFKKSRKKILSGGKNKVEIYWEFGSVIRKIFFESNLVTPSEKDFFWINIRNRAPKELLAEDRGPNRIHIEYCFRLAYYPKEIAMKREWSEWVYLFDSPFVNKELRFEKWDSSKISEEPEKINRETTRLFIQCLNSILNDVETTDLSEEELFRCYEGAWLISSKLISDNKNNKEILKKTIFEKRINIGKLMKGEMRPTDFCKLITDSIN